MLIIGIAGGTGSGKTTVVNNILNNLNSQNVLVISQDNYYKAHNDLSFTEREKINVDHQTSIEFNMLTENNQDINNGKTIEPPIYSFITHSRKDETNITQPKEAIIVEGISVFTQPELKESFDLKLF